MVELLDIVGQDGVIAELQRALAGLRRPHAYLFAGPAGVGRRTTALALARTLLCAKPRTRANAGRLANLPKDFTLRQACGQCADCRAAREGAHADLHLVYKELARYHDDPAVRDRVMQDLGIDVIRTFLIAPAGRAAARGRGKVFVVLESELLNAASQNALLKTLEEPPEGVTIILICRQPERMLATTLSRCRLLRFGPLPRDFVRGKLAEAGVQADQAAFWAELTEGSLGRALDLAAKGMYAVKRELLERLAGQAGPADLADYLVKETDRLAGEAVAEARKADGTDLSKLLASRRAAGVMLELIASAFRDAMALAAGSARPPVHADQKSAVAALAERLSLTQLAEILQQLSRYEQLLWRNVNPKLVWDNAAITCTSAAPLRL